MKKTIIFALLATAGVCASCNAQNVGDGSMTVTLPADFNAPQLKVEYALLNDMLNAKVNNLKVNSVDVPVENHEAHMTLPAEAPARYSIVIAPDVNADFYAAPDENIIVNIASVSPLDYTVTGTALMDGMTKLSSVTEPLEDEFAALSASGNATQEQLESVYDRYDAAVKDFLKDNMNSPAAAFALLNIGGQDFLDAYENLGTDARNSILMPFVEQRKERAVKEAAAEKFQKQLASGEIVAPDFTLPDTEGKSVSLSDFKGKWVVIDFWGSWCGWCIKGFPALKKAYTEADGKFVVIGVDCRDSEEAWRAAIAKYELPWINLYNANTEGGVLADYMVTGFPTKAIVSPDGKLVDITVGEDPSFFDKLNKFMTGK